jgi:hypothetical protein
MVMSIDHLLAKLAQVLETHSYLTNNTPLSSLAIAYEASMHLFDVNGFWEAGWSLVNVQSFHRVVAGRIAGGDVILDPMVTLVYPGKLETVPARGGASIRISCHCMEAELRVAFEYALSQVNNDTQIISSYALDMLILDWAMRGTPDFFQEKVSDEWDNLGHALASGLGSSGSIAFFEGFHKIGKSLPVFNGYASALELGDSELYPNLQRYRLQDN